MLDNEQADGAEDNTRENSTQETVDDTSKIKSEIETLKSQTSEVLQKFNQFLSSQNEKKEEKKPLSKEEFSNLLKENPEQAIALALDSKVQSRVSDIEKSLTVKQQQTYYDQKAEQDFPLLNKDKEFMELVKTETKSLVEDGMDRSSPRLVYKAAQIASLKYKAKESKSENSNSMSSEAPNNVRKSDPNSKYVPKTFSKMADMFGLSDKAREKAKENFAFRAQNDERRRNRG